MNKKLLAPISLFLVFSFVFAFVGCSAKEKEEETSATVGIRTPLPVDKTSSVDSESRVVTDAAYSPEALAANSKTIFDYFNLHINEIKGAKARVEMSESKKIEKARDENGESVPISDDKYINAAVSSLSKYALHEEKATAEYGDDLVQFMPVKGQSYVSALTFDDIESATCADSGTERTVTLTLKSPALPSTLEKAYDMGDPDAVLDEFKKAEKYLTVGKPTLQYKDCQIVVRSDVETDEVYSVEYIKNVDVKVEVTGAGKLESLGTVPVTFRYRHSATYSIDGTNPDELASRAEK